jgi:glycosyltransferase involved in cell wall biosynthesis
MSRRILMVAFQYPPFGSSSGMQRTLSFSRELSRHDWQPLVLAPSIRAYPRVSHDLDAKIPRDVVVRRSFALDASRHLAVAGRYLAWTTLPDQWSTWWFSGVMQGWKMIRQYRPDVIWSTYPTATAHLIALTLQRLSGVPWVADFRDPMVYEGWPDDPLVRRVRSWVERQTIRRCTRAVFVTDSARQLYQERYATVPAARLAVIANGYDEESFNELALPEAPSQRRPGPLLLVHSGLLEPSDRNPTPFFEALAALRDKGLVTAESVRVVLRASGSEDIYQRKLEQCGLSDIVHLAPRVGYAEALVEMMAADGLLVFQGSDCNRQIPAKIYEYLRAKKPILALTDPEGETATLLQGMGVDTLARLDSKDDIQARLEDFLQMLQNGVAPVPSDELVARHSRQWKAKELASLLDEVVAEG